MLEKELKVRLRNGFSDRNGFKKENTKLQIKSLDERTRITICNTVDLMFHEVYDDGFEAEIQMFIKNFLRNVYVQEVDFSPEVSIDQKKFLEIIKNSIKSEDFDNVFSLLEYFINNIQKDVSRQNFFVADVVNRALESEYVGYRYVEGTIVPITDKKEIESITSGMNTPYYRVNAYFVKAVELISDRKRKDFSAVITESMHGVEEMCSIILGKRGTLFACLNRLKKEGFAIHPAFYEMFNTLYEFTSDAGGIHHIGQLDAPGATFGEARFVLVTCTAFVNYLIQNGHNHWNQNI